MITNDKLVEIEQALGNDVLAEAIGQKLAKMLHLRKSKSFTDAVPRFQTSWGSKTNIGLARSVMRLIADEMTV